MQTETFLPCFPGFYETQFEFNNEDQELEYINERRAETGLPAISYDDVKWSYTDYRQNVCKKAVSYIEQELNDLGLECKLTFKELKSPREYNFSTDVIYIDADFDPEQLRKMFMDVDSDALPGFFGRFLPRPGFSPFSETVKKAELSYWQETDFNNFHDFGLACELVLSSHIESEFNMDDFAFESTHEVEVGIDNYHELVP